MTIESIEKRDGRQVPFQPEKIKQAIFKAAKAVNKPDQEIAAQVAEEVLSYLNIFFNDGGVPTVEQIQDLVEKVLIEQEYPEIAKAYILYREQHNKLRHTEELFSDALDSINNYLGRNDWKVNENSNMSYSLQGLNNHIASEVTAQYWLQEIYPQEVREKHKSGDLHIHDLGNLSVYCCGWDLKDLLLNGFSGVPTKVESAPPKHFQTALMQTVNFFYTLQGEAAGAQALSNFDTYLAPFIHYDDLSYKEVKQSMQEFIFNLNVPTRVGFQTPFTNITMDLNVPNMMADEPVIIGGEYQDETYGQFEEELDMFNRAFAEVMLAGDKKGRVFSFPIPTYNITEDFDWDNEVLNPVWEMTAKYGIPYFNNMVNSDMDPEDVRSMCCRLRLDNTELRKRGGALFGSNPMTGSIGVVTINMPRIGYLADDKQEFIDRVHKLMDIAQESLEIKRKVLERLTDNGLYPYSKFYLRQVKERFDEYWKNHFNTIGLNGMNEALLNFMGQDIASKEGRDFAIEVMEAMRDRLVDYQEETGNIYNLEATPAEGTSYRFAKMDKEKFGADIICANQDRVVNGNGDPYYTNSTQLPVDYTTDIFEAFKLQDPLQTRYNGGCIEKGNRVLTNKGAIKIEKIVNNYKNLKPIKALSYNPDKKESEWDLITDAMSIDVTHNDKIRVKGEKKLDITTSDWHPFFVLEKIPVNKKCPICKKEISGVKGFASHMKYSLECREEYNKMNKYQVVEKRADELKPGDYILQNNDNLYPNKNTNLNQDLMWLIGYFIGDGATSQFKDNRGGNNLTKYKLRLFDSNKPNLIKAKNIINANFNTNINVIQNDKRSDELYHLKTSKQKVIDFFFKYGFSAGEKTYNIKIPSQVKSELNKQNVYALLSGLLDSDGHINKKYGNSEYYTVSKALAYDLVEICSQAGIMITKENKPTKRNNESDGFRLTIPAYQMTMLKERLTIVNDRKHIKDDLSNRKLRQLPVTRVTETTKVNVEDNQFYDLTTKNNHNYLAGNNTMVFIHNTVLHGFLGERMPSIESTKKLVRRLANNFELPYYSITPTFSICPEHGYLAGEHEYCPKCDAEIGYEENEETELGA